MTLGSAERIDMKNEEAALMAKALNEAAKQIAEDRVQLMALNFVLRTLVEESPDADAIRANVARRWAESADSLGPKLGAEGRSTLEAVERLLMTGGYFPR